MKKIIIIVLTLILVFSACEEASNYTPKISLPLKVTAKLKGNEACFIATVKETTCEISFDRNHTLYGTTLYFDESGGTAMIADFKREIIFSAFPAQNAFIKALRTICSNPNLAVRTDFGVKYAIDEMTILVYYKENTEEIIGITTEESGRRFEFTIVALESI